MTEDNRQEVEEEEEKKEVKHTGGCTSVECDL